MMVSRQPGLPSGSDDETSDAGPVYHLVVMMKPSMLG
jgi:hypothetical protein